MLHVIPSVGPSRGGPSAMAPAMCRALSEHGVTCDLVTTNDDGDGLLDEKTGEWANFQGVRTWFHPRVNFSIRAVREYQYAIGFSGWLEERIGGYDLLHVHAMFSYLPTCAMRIARRYRVPYVVRPCGLLERISLGRSAVKKGLYSAILERANLDGAAAFHLTSRRELEVSRLPANVPRWVILPGIDSTGHAVNLRERTDPGAVPRVLFLSRWDPKKRMGLLLDAMARLGEERWELVLAGSGDALEIEKVQRVASGLGIGAKVSFPGFLRGADKWSAMLESDIFVLPSESENFGVSVAEALSVGLPAVVTRGVALADEIEEARAGWVSGDGVEDLAQCLRKAITDSSDRCKRGENAFELAADKLSWSACATKLVERYGEVPGSR